MAVDSSKSNVKKLLTTRPFQFPVIMPLKLTSRTARDNWNKVHTPTNVHFIKLDRVLKFTLKITLTCSYMFQSTTIIREPSLEPIQSYI